MKRILLSCALVLFGGYSVFAACAVTDVTARQRYPWNGLVDIVVTLEGASNDVADADWYFAATNTATQVALQVAHITRNGSDSGSGTTWTRRFVWDAAADVGAVRIDDVTLTVDAKVLDYVQLWENGPCWAKCNIGASKPEEYGYYFWWGDTVGYKREGGTWTDDDNYLGVTWVSSTGTRMSNSPFDRSACPTMGKSTSQLQSAGYIDSTGNLVAAHDAATAHLGAPWRMPTDAEMSALISNCTTTWITTNGVSGRLVVGKGAYASRSIFLPAAGGGVGSSLLYPGSGGFVWSSTPNSGYAMAVDFHSAWFDCVKYDRYNGHSVRPLRGFAK